MLGSVRSSFTRCAIVLTIVNTLALVNPFCCHLLPHFTAEQVQTEVAFDGVDQTCAGKPDSQRECVFKLGEPMPAALWHHLSVAEIVQSEWVPLTARKRSASPPALARHRLLGIYLV